MFGYTFYWSLVWDAIPELLAGAWLTVQLAALSMLLGTVFGLPLAVARRQGEGRAYRLATAWVELARNTPTLFQIYMMYFGLGALGIQISSYWAVLIALTFNNTGYLAEIFRGGLAGIARQQLAAARSLGLNQRQGYLHVVFPQLLRIVFPGYVTQAVWAMLNTSLGMLVGLQELSGAAQSAQSVSFRSFEFFLITALIYYVIAKLIEFGARAVFWRWLRT
ncbi:amino acid ABC transporter permease [Pseudomonas typographi]|uniref:Amino acid ABC transporter permease n=1 Tax=Pseudomonas typographi TaxID=2715964 RepID=A0ABR7Z733_9PSED|nr:amino acid ABC transporter permease [Pseudomonas typographi]MBD1551119.1 amino acid ABC transporter permease [Pseudomonas typographi]MBD1586387.1 amino acid ABC transporter permease [Pseudomonas typographi]MBD1601346.1 amino acid ABC transporter permease [Pseudomonas typographi]